jgi:NADH-quinone oxidoreductase subunit G
VVAKACAELLNRTNHVGRVNNGLIGAWHNGNTQGAWELGFETSTNLAADLGKALTLLIAGADPVGDDPLLGLALGRSAFVVVQEIFLTETAKLANVVLPALPFTEREGSFTSGERRVQRFYPAVPPRGSAKPDFAITAGIAQKMGIAVEGRAASLVMARIAQSIPAFAGITFQKLAESPEQFPHIGRSEVYYGGTSYDNRQGVGVQLPLVAAREIGKIRPLDAVVVKPGQLLVVPVTRLYDRGSLTAPSKLLGQRMAQPVLEMHPATAKSFGLAEGQVVMFEYVKRHMVVGVHLDESLPEDVALLPRSVNVPISQPMAVELKIEQAARSGAATKG